MYGWKIAKMSRFQHSLPLNVPDQRSDPIFLKRPSKIRTCERKSDQRLYSLQRIGDEGVCSIRAEPSFRGILTRKTSLARVLFFLEPAIPIRASTSAFRSFRIPTQSTLWNMVRVKCHVNQKAEREERENLMNVNRCMESQEKKVWGHAHYCLSLPYI